MSEKFFLSDTLADSTKKSFLKQFVLLVSNIIPIRVAFILPFALLIIFTVSIVGYISFINNKKSVYDLLTKLVQESSHRTQDKITSLLKSPLLLNQIYINAFKSNKLNAREVQSMELFFWHHIQSFKQVSHSFFCNTDGDFVGARLLSNGSFGTMLGDKSTNNNKSYHYFSNDENGKRIALLLERPKNDARKRPWYQKAVDTGKTTWSPIYTTIDAKTLAIAASQPIYINNNELAGVVGVNFNLTLINDFLKSLDIVKNGEIFIMERSGLIVSSSTSAPNTRTVEDKIERIKASESTNELISLTAKYIHNNIDNLTKVPANDLLMITINNDKHILELTPIKNEFGLDWLIVVVLPVHNYLEQVIDNNRITLFILFIALFLSITIGILMARWILNPIAKLNTSTIAMTQGDWEQKVVIDRNDELGQLAQSFNLMAGYINSLLNNLNENVNELHNEVQHRKETEKSLTKAQNYIKNIINSMPSLLVGIDPNGIITLWNKQAEIITNVKAEDAKGRILYDIYPDIKSESHNIEESIDKKIIINNRKKSLGKDNTITYEDVTIYPITSNGIEGAVIRIDDITDKVRMEELMIQSEKMLSVGGLAAGMAHEINNPLAGMIQTSNVLENRLGNKLNIPASLKIAKDIGIDVEDIKIFMEKRGVPRMLNTIKESGHRVASIVENMLNFARKSDSIRSSHDMCILIDKTLELAAADYDLKKHFDFKHIKIVREYEKDLPQIPCEMSKIQQVILNIIRNGSQAMQKANTEHPCFTIRVYHNHEINMITTEIEDNGPGIQEDSLKRVFEPFYTTKSAGIGTGLGLSVSYFIITENHGGQMSVESQAKRGANFIISLPIA